MRDGPPPGVVEIFVEFAIEHAGAHGGLVVGVVHGEGFHILEVDADRAIGAAEA